MSTDDSSTRSLSSLLQAAETQRQKLESFPSATSSDYASTLQQAVRLYTQCLEQVSAVSLFSSNEGLEDVSTSSLPYLSLDYHLGEVAAKTPTPSPRERRAVLQASRRAYERFLALTDNYGLVSAPYDRYLERYRDDEGGFTVVAAGDPGRKRDAKITNFRAEKELRDKLATLKRNPRYLEEEEECGGRGGGDEEIVREVLLTDLRYKIHQTFGALEGIGLEEGMLAMAPSGTEDFGHRPDARDDAQQRRSEGTVNASGTAAEYDARLDMPLTARPNGRAGGGPLLTKKGKPLQPFTLVGSRQELARGVFRPGHNLPTMSIDEYLEEEKRRGGILEGGGAQSNGGGAVVDEEDDVEAADRETYKAREWDDFKDANPRGSGNTLNMG